MNHPRLNLPFKKIDLRPSVLLTIFSIFASSSAFAVNQNLYLGALIGANFPNGDSGSSTSPVFGATIGTKLTPEFGIGFLGTYYGQGNSGSTFGLPTGTSTRTFNLLGQASFFVSYFHMGADIGTTIKTWSGNFSTLSGSSSDTALIVGPQAGFDIPLGTSALSIGGEAHYLFNTASNSQNNLLLMGVLKIWL